MNPDSTRLELAREAWLQAQPTDAEVLAGAQRARRSLSRARRRARPRLPSALVACALIFGAALAYAAAAAWWGRTTRDTVPPAPTRASSRPTAPGSATTAMTARAPTPDRPTTPAGAASTPAPVGQSRAAHPSPRPSAEATAPRASASPASWSAIDAALARGDERRAQQALAALARRGTDRQRSKALVGLAQLAASRGDCARARQLASEVTALDPDGAQTRRARRVAAECAASDRGEPRSR